MKDNHKHTPGRNVAIITVALILICQNVNTQPGYNPMLRMPPYHSIIVPYPPAQGYRQDYNPYIHTDVVHTLISLGIHFDPLISWFSTYSYDTRNEGVVPGFNFGISYNSFFGPNYSFSSGINIINAGGRLITRDITYFEFKNNNPVTVQPGEAITYKITYLSMPLGLKLQTSEIYYRRFYTDFGFDPKIVIGGRADIPSLNINGGNALPELNTFNLSFHIMAGMEYKFGVNNSFVIGIGFENNLFDITRDNGGQQSNEVYQKSLSFRMGFNF